MLNGWLGGEWRGWIGGGRLPPYPGGLHIIWAAALSAEPTLICGPQPHYGLDPHSRPHNAMQGSTGAQSVRQCARVLGGKKRPDVPVPGGPGLYRLPKIGKLQKLGNWGCGRRPTGMLQFLSPQHSYNCQYIIEESAYLWQVCFLTVWLWLTLSGSLTSQLAAWSAFQKVYLKEVIAIGSFLFPESEIYDGGWHGGGRVPYKESVMKILC